MNTILRWAICLTSLFMVGCGSISDYQGAYGSVIALNASNVEKLNGTYTNFPVTQDSSLSYQSLSHNLNWRENKKGQDTLQISEVKIQIMDEEYLDLSYLDKQKVVYTKRIKYRLQKNGFVFLKNKNLRVIGIPYILGEYDVNKFELGLNANEDLIINGFTREGGGVLIVLSSGWGYAVNQKYLRQQ